ncbi:uncharacterized protein BCR38DRAFT_491272 [Pseudomassariella vexata]|uniref:Uncharacterized protein n=1 Tax=Pseudomassariella vexata TaxID=1141098 RepID=A0A1Y2D906_9PEZI|nr:uncharacterized protein BCR38DRAFT_491272 [Pseudomassariella vexata]ORY55125.1 hypothetical protein BCR38DRAFT_491272 [Pseudomassariella vexata]
MASSFLKHSIAAVALAHAVSSSDFRPGENSPAPYDIPFDTWKTYMDFPDITNNIDMTGPKLSNSTSLGTQKWNLSILISDDVPLRDSPVEPDKAQKVFTGTKIGIAPPSGGQNVPDDTQWNACALIIRPGFKTSSEMTKQIGSDGWKHCQFVSEECKTALKRVTLDAYRLINSRTDPCAIGNWALPSSCNDYFTWYSYTQLVVNQSTLVNGGHVLAYGDDPHNPTNQAFLSAARDKVWPVILTWRQATLDKDKNTVKHQYVQSTLECISGSSSRGSRTDRTDRTSPNSAPGKVRSLSMLAVTVATGLALI